MSAIGFNGKLYGQEPTISQKLLDLAVVLSADRWVDTNGVFTQTVNVKGMPNSATPVISLVGDEVDAYVCLTDCVAENESLIFIADSKPTVDFTVVCKGVVASKYNAIQDLMDFSEYGLTLGEDEEETTLVPRDADLLDGKKPEFYAKKSELDQVNDNLANFKGITIIANGASANDAISMPTNYLNNKYEITVVSRIIVNSVAFKGIKTMGGNEFVSQPNGDTSFADGCYANATYNRSVEWIVPKNSNYMRLNAFWVNGTNYITSAKTWVYARRATL